MIELDLYGPPNDRLTGKAAQLIIEGLSHSLVKLALPCIAEETKPLGINSIRVRTVVEFQCAAK